MSTNLLEELLVQPAVAAEPWMERGHGDTTLTKLPNWRP